MKHPTGSAISAQQEEVGEARMKNGAQSHRHFTVLRSNKIRSEYRPLLWNPPTIGVTRLAC